MKSSSYMEMNMRISIRMVTIAAILAFGAGGAVADGLTPLLTCHNAKQLASDNAAVYILKNDGHIFTTSFGGWTRVTGSPLSIGKGIASFAVARGTIYTLYDKGTGYGEIWRAGVLSWNDIYLGKMPRQMIARSGAFYVLNQDGEISTYSWSTWRRLDDGGNYKAFTVDEDGNLYAANHSGNICQLLRSGKWELIYQHPDDGRSGLIDDHTGTKQLEVYKGVLYALKDNGSIWRRTVGGIWTTIDNSPDNKLIKLDGQWLHALKNDGSIWTNHMDRWTRVDDGTDLAAFDAAGGMLYLLKKNGDVFRGIVSDLLRSADFDQLHGEN